MMKSVDTYYAGRRFRSMLEARWAVYFDACGVGWDYEPETFELQNGIKYIPDFLVETNEGEIWVEVKGELTDRDREKLKHFERPIFMVGELRGARGFKQKSPEFYTRYYIDGSRKAAFPCISKDGGLTLFGDNYVTACSWTATVEAICIASSARFWPTPMQPVSPVSQGGFILGAWSAVGAVKNNAPEAPTLPKEDV